MAMTVLAKARARLVMTAPFYATILLSMKVEYTERLWLAGTNGTTLFINPVGFEKLTLQQAIGVLKHEVLHVAFLHPWRAGSRIHKQWNKATDYAINQIIFDEGGELPDGVLYNESLSGGRSSEAIYALLPDEQDDGTGGDGNEGDGDGNPLAGDLEKPAGDGQSQAMQEAQAKQLVAKAVQVAKATGTLPGALKEFFDELFAPKIPWQEVLRRFLVDVARTDYSFARPNRRFIASGEYLPGLHSMGSMRTLGVVIDTSGSIGTDELKRFFGEVVGAIEAACPSQIIVVYCDCTVNAVDHLDAPTEEDVRTTMRREGGGGTDMRVALGWFDEHKPDVAAVLVFTDGYTPVRRTDYPTLWCCTTGVELDVDEVVRIDA